LPQSKIGRGSFAADPANAEPRCPDCTSEADQGALTYHNVGWGFDVLHWIERHPGTAALGPGCWCDYRTRRRGSCCAVSGPRPGAVAGEPCHASSAGGAPGRSLVPARLRRV